MSTTTGGAPEGFSKAAGSYDDAVRHNIAGSRRLVDEIEADLRAARLEPLDIWMERRRRATPPDAFMARTRSVAGHLLGNPPGGFSELDQRIEGALHAESGPDGFVYDYCKLFAVAQSPAD